MSRMKHDNVVITAVTAGRGSGGAIMIGVVLAGAIMISQTFSTEINPVLDWAVGGVVACVVAWFVWMIHDDIPRPGEARRVTAWSAVVDEALAAKHARDEAEATRLAAVVAVAEAALADDPAASDELAARRAAREAG